MERFGLGWAPDRWDALTEYLRRRDFAVEQIEAAGLAIQGERGLHDRFRARVMFPIRDPDGKVSGFGGRTLGDGQPKYLNSPQTATFDKSATLYALDSAKAGIRKAGYAVIVEGYMTSCCPTRRGSPTSSPPGHGPHGAPDRAPAPLHGDDRPSPGRRRRRPGGDAAGARGRPSSLAAQRRPVPGRATRTGYLSLSSDRSRSPSYKGVKTRTRSCAKTRRMATAGGGRRPDDGPQGGSGARPGRPPGSPEQDCRRARAGPLPRASVPDPIEWGHYIDRIAQRLRLDLRAVRDEVDRASRALRDEQRRQQQRQQASARPRPAAPRGPL